MKDQPKGFDTPFGRGVMRRLSQLNVHLYRLTRGRVGGSLPTPSGRVPVGLLHHVGRTTGFEPRVDHLQHRRGRAIVGHQINVAEILPRAFAEDMEQIARRRERLTISPSSHDQPRQEN